MNVLCWWPFISLQSPGTHPQAQDIQRAEQRHWIETKVFQGRASAFEEFPHQWRRRNSENKEVPWIGLGVKSVKGTVRTQRQRWSCLEKMGNISEGRGCAWKLQVLWVSTTAHPAWPKHEVRFCWKLSSPTRAMEYLCDVHTVLSLDLPFSEVDRWMERRMCWQVGKARDIDRSRGKEGI